MERLVIKQMRPEIVIGKRKIGLGHKPLVMAEIGINHSGNIRKAIKMVDDAYRAGCECVKFQCHIVEEEMISSNVIPPNAKESIWDIICGCELSEDEEIRLKKYAESKGMLYLSTPFSRAASDRLEQMGVLAYKIGSGECNNYPLIKHIASFKKPVILSTGMNDIEDIKKAVLILHKNNVRYALLHCTSMYPTPYNRVRLGAISELASIFPDAVVGLSDHSIGNYAAFASVAIGARILEKHFTSSRKWKGPDISFSINPQELKELIKGANAIFEMLGGGKGILKEERPVINFAYSCVVAIRDIKAGELLSTKNIWVKRPGTGQIKAVDFERMLGKKARRFIPNNSSLRWSDLKR